MDLDPNDYILCGSDGFSRMYPKQSKWNDTGIAYFKKCFPDMPYPKHSKTCLCGHHIFENCYITTRDMNYNNILTIGNCCYKHYVIDLNTNCLSCNAPHSNGINRNKGLCDDCKRINKDTKKAKKRKLSELNLQIKRESKDMINQYKKHLESSFNHIMYMYHIVDNSIRSFNREANNMINQYKSHLESSFNDLKRSYNIVEDSIEAFNAESNYMINQYKTHVRFHFNDLIDSYNIMYNSIKLLNKFYKCRSINKKITFVYKPEYSIANIYNKFTLVYRMNLKTCKPTASSPDQKPIIL
jgi:ribosomal protein S17E